MILQITKRIANIRFDQFIQKMLQTKAFLQHLPSILYP